MSACNPNLEVSYFLSIGNLTAQPNSVQERISSQESNLNHEIKPIPRGSELIIVGKKVS
jgi:hypothetical protein